MAQRGWGRGSGDEDYSDIINDKYAIPCPWRLTWVATKNSILPNSLNLFVVHRWSFVAAPSIHGPQQHKCGASDACLAIAWLFAVFSPPPLAPKEWTLSSDRSAQKLLLWAHGWMMADCNYFSGPACNNCLEYSSNFLRALSGETGSHKGSLSGWRF